jgi:hypothetical protein
MPPHDPWQKHLEDQLAEDIQGLKALEDARRIETDPKRKLGLEKDIADLVKHIQDHRKQLESLNVAEDSGQGKILQNTTTNRGDTKFQPALASLETDPKSTAQLSDSASKRSQTARIALLIGVSEYATGFAPIPGAKMDVTAIEQVLRPSELGNFDEVIPLINPDAQEMRQAIEKLFTGRKQDDLLLLFFSGHGIKDNSGKLYFGTRTTCKNSDEELVKSSAVSANFIHDIMNDCRSRQQVVILDCCFSGAFAAGLLTKDDGAIDVKVQLGGEGRVILASSTSTQYSFGRQNAEPSMYTRYLVEGIQTGEADLDQDSFISISELHQYARDKVREILPSLNPKIYAEREGYKIQLAKAPASRNIALLHTNSSQQQIVTQQNRIPSKRNLKGILLLGSVVLAAIICLSYVLTRRNCTDITEKIFRGDDPGNFYTYRDKNHPQRKICEIVGAELPLW